MKTRVYLLTPQEGPAEVKEKKKESWQCSVGSFSSKTALTGLVKKKVLAKQSPASTSQASLPVKCEAEEVIQVKDEVQTEDRVTNGDSEQKTAAGVDVKPSCSSTGLGMLGEYSDSDLENSE